jgi:hypothetical protein
MSEKRDIAHIQSHTEYVRSQPTCRGCGISVPTEGGRATGALCDNCSPSRGT